MFLPETPSAVPTPKTYWDKIGPAKLVILQLPPDDLADASPRYMASMRARKLDHMTEEQIRLTMRGYYGNLAFADAMLGEVLKALDDLDLRDRTLVAYHVDHGEMLYEHGLWTKGVFFGPSVRVPLIVRLPGVTPEGKESRALIEMIDLFPTIMDILNVADLPPTVQGRSFLPVLAGKTDRHRDVVRSEHDRSEGRD